MKRRSRLVFVLLFLAAAYLVYWAVNKEIANFTYTTFGDNIPDEYPVMGMDISHYQGEINWDQVNQMRIEDDSIQFVFIKATEGLNLEDDRKRSNAYGARGADIDYGFYHFFIPSQSSRKQAEFFCEEIGGYNFDLRPVVDVEPNGQISGKGLRDSVKVFLDFVESRLQVRPVIYTYHRLYEDHFSDMDELFWVAKYSGSCPAMDDENVIIWQFSESGNVDGIGEDVDLNVAKENFFEKISRR